MWFLKTNGIVMNVRNARVVRLKWIIQILVCTICSKRNIYYAKIVCNRFRTKTTVRSVSRLFRMNLVETSFSVTSVSYGLMLIAKV